MAYCFSLCFHKFLTCSLPAGPPWPRPRSGEKSHLPLGGEYGLSPPIIMYRGLMFYLHFPGYAALSKDIPSASALPVRVSPYFGTGRGHWRFSVSPASTAAGCSSDPSSTYTPPWPDGTVNHHCKWNRSSPLFTSSYPHAAHALAGHPNHRTACSCSPASVLCRFGRSR